MEEIIFRSLLKELIPTTHLTYITTFIFPQQTLRLCKADIAYHCQVLYGTNKDGRVATQTRRIGSSSIKKQKEREREREEREREREKQK